MTSREQFEAWLICEYPWAIDALNMAFYQGDEETGYYTGGDFIYDGSSCSEALFWAWRGWQASREAVEVELPEPHAHVIWVQAGNAPDDYWDDVEISRSEQDKCCDGSDRYPVYACHEVVSMLDSAGVKVKGE